MLGLVVCGLGRAGSGYGVDDRGLAIQRSHIGAAVSSGAFEIKGIVETDANMREKATSSWGEVLGGAHSVADLNDMKGIAVDVIALATSPMQRRLHVEAALSLGPKVLLVEKPLATNVEEAAQIVEMCRVAGAALRVNFQRATDPAHIAVRNEVENVPLGANAKIGGGHFNYGSHVVDLVLDWFGAARSVSAFPIAAGAKSPDDEPALDFRISLEAGFECLIQSVSGAHFDIFEIEVLFEDRALRLSNGGVEKYWSCAVEDLYYPGYTQLWQNRCSEELVDGLTPMYRSIADHLERGGELIGASGERAAHGIAILEAAVRSAAAFGEAQQVAYPWSRPTRDATDAIN